MHLKMTRDDALVLQRALFALATAEPDNDDAIIMLMRVSNMIETTHMSFIIHDESIIWAIGETEEAAWKEFHEYMKTAGYVPAHTTDDENVDTYDVAHYSAINATDRLIEAVEKEGGNISYSLKKIGGRVVACTDQERYEEMEDEE